MRQSSLTSEGLRAAIGFPSAVMLVVGGMVGVGIFVNPAVVARSLHSAPLVLAAWGLGGAVAALGTLIYAELAARMPDTGGEYVYLREAFGPLAGFLFGWTTLLVVQAGGMAAVAIVFAKNLNVLLDGRAPEGAIVVLILAALAAVNCLGVGAGNGVQGWLGVLKVAAIATFILAGLFLLPPASRTAVAPEASFGVAASVKAFGAAMIPIVFSFGGWQTANYVAGEMKDPRRNLGRALMAGVALVIVIYMLMNLVGLRDLGVRRLGSTLTPVSDVLRLLAGPLGAKIAAGAIALSAVGYLSQSMLTAPRVYFAMARDGLFFRRVAELAASSRAPVIAILVQAAWTGVLALSGSYEQILSYVIAMNFLFFGVTASSLFLFRIRDRRRGSRLDPDGFRTPFQPVTTGLFVLACAAVVASSFWSYPVDSLIGYAIMALGVPPYLFWRKRRSSETSSPP